MHAREAIKPLAMQGIPEEGSALTLFVMHTGHQDALLALSTLEECAGYRMVLAS